MMWLLIFLILVAILMFIYYLGKSAARRKTLFDFMYGNLSMLQTFRLGLFVIKMEIMKLDYRYEVKKCQIQLVYLLRKWKKNLCTAFKKVKSFLRRCFDKFFGEF